MGAI
jgi:NADH-ubiquinone oxidoreductase chain 5